MSILYTTIQGNLKSNCTNCIDFDMANLMAVFFCIKKAIKNRKSVPQKDIILSLKIFF